MADKEKGAEEGAKSLLDKSKGKVKQAAGNLTGDDGLKEQGEREQKRGELREDAAEERGGAEKKEAEADAKEAKADAKRQEAEGLEG